MESNEVRGRKLAFDECAHRDEDGVEFWFARDIMQPLGYTKWQNFEIAIRRAMVSCEMNKTPVRNHFTEVSKMVLLGSGSSRRVRDYKLTRYACYLIAQNGDPRKEEIALAQAYFAVQTRRQEIIEQRMAEIQRMQSRKTLAESERRLSGIVFERDVDARGFATIKSKGDAALFGGHNTADMKERLGVAQKEPLADRLSTVAISAKSLANSMTSHNVERRDLRGVGQIGFEHVGNNLGVRKTLLDRGIVPEDLPPEESTKGLERRLRSDERSLVSELGEFLGCTLDTPDDDSTNVMAD